MIPRALFCTFCLSVALSGGLAQTDPPKPAATAAEAPKPAATAPTPRETPADQKAYTEANKVKDPAEKLKALEKFKADFPKSDMKSIADSAILSTLVKKFPEQKGRIMKQAKAMYKAAEPRNQGSLANQIAMEFLDAGRFLGDAEGWAKKGVADMQQPRYIADLKAGYEKRKQKLPSDEELAKRFREARASRVATLGRIEVARGQNAKGQKLLQEAWAANPNLVVVGATLGELAYKSGNDSKALEFLVPAKLSGRATESASAALVAVYKRQHSGSADGLDAMLDAQYRKLYPNPVNVEEYRDTDKRSDRLVLAEVFTGSGCPPCVGADVAFDAAMERFSRKDLAVVMYHEHVPRPDPMTNPDTTARSKYYDVHGVPSYAIDGNMLGGGGGGREYAKNVYERIVTPIEKDLELPAEAKLSAHAAVSGNLVKVTGSADGVKGEPADVKVQVLLVEKEIRYTGENGIRFHPMVVRAIGEEKTGTFSRTFNLDEVSAALKKHLDEYEAGGHRGEAFKFIEKKYAIDHANLAVVVMVQNMKTKHILQSAMVDLSTGGGTRISTETK
jgi:thiol-disulfide isomerase/thioredoxin